jgi:short-subunit dehydrogenase
VDEVAAALQDVTLLVNNAGIAHPGPPLSASLDRAREELEVNYLGSLRMAQAFNSRLDVLVNVLSVASFRPLLGLSTYAASKAAAWSITHALREELEGETLVVAVHAGFIDTDLAAAIPDDRIAPGQVAEATLDAIRNGGTEVLVDEVSRATKAALSVT